MISIEHISKSYGDHIVLDDLSAMFAGGEITMLLGPSGCGKSTLLKLINRLIMPDSGRILIDGKDISTFREEHLRRGIGYAIQGVGLFPHMRVGDNIGVVPGLLKWPRSRIENRVDELLELVGLSSDFKVKYPLQLSGGEAQRVGVARALAADPEILLMDEPFGALDPINRQRLQQEFLKIQRQLHKTVVFVTHDVTEALVMADQLILLKDRKILAHGDPCAIVNKSEAILKSFTGGSAALELLEKYRISDISSQLPPVHDRPIASNAAVSENLSLKEALALMVVKNEDSLTVETTSGKLRLDFAALRRVLRGCSS